MKRIVFASIAILLSMSAAHAGWRNNRSCFRGGCNRSAVCAQPAAACPEKAPTCCKTVMVDQVIKVPKTVEVPARRIVTPVPDVIEYVPVAPVEVRIPQPPIPQPDRIEYKCMPDRVVRHPQQPCISYECPSDCKPNGY